ncbi:uracil-DNA glycosylase [Panine betaherpesvirus 2]|uniref:Uracil-DNA glycosylase n=1 Tax=Panine betaherpesvirus 2 TaxID=188763 RepID=Q8QRZ4_9BETA|nr:uracil-DNA glycosylase [Panine betaherpesvirus 2]AAM00744.1 uracil-DNA glycosylase [Panine betaherpesvirus 2]QXV67858.1 uracil-DNA glycosylase [Panine betaherpesvirus 2]
MALREWMLANIADNKGCMLNPDEQARVFCLSADWVRFLSLPEHDTALLRETVAAVESARQRGVVYPPPEHVHRWSFLCSPERVRVVIVGQDPYCDGSASGLAFGTMMGKPPPPSLNNVFREVARTVDGFRRPTWGCLDAWCQRGVLLLNTVFTVVHGQPGSHRHLGWQTLSGRVIRRLSELREHLVFMLWGAEAQSCEYLIDRRRHLVLKACHPSPKNTSKSFVGNDHFVLANAYLDTHYQETIDWRLDS